MWKRVVVISDMHCGHGLGLTPPEYQWKKQVDKTRSSWGKYQSELWNWYKHTVFVMCQAKKPDLVIVNGDCIDGDGPKNHTELITTDRDIQVQMAVQALRFFGKVKFGFTYGTDYHNGKYEDWEKQVAERYDAPIHDKYYVSIKDVTIMARHHIGGSSLPWGEFTSPARSATLSRLSDGPDVNVTVFGHTHKYNYCGTDEWMSIRCPAMTAMPFQDGSKYARRCEGRISMGFITLDIRDSGLPELTPYLCRLPKHIEVTKL